MMRALTLTACVVAALFLYVAPAHPQDGSGDYDTKWRDAAAALVAFSNAALLHDDAQVNLATLAPVYRRERARFASALAALAKLTPPRDRLLSHWQLLPAHEGVLSAMTLASDAAERGDTAAMSAAWDTLRDQVAILRRTLGAGSAAR